MLDFLHTRISLVLALCVLVIPLTFSASGTAHAEGVNPDGGPDLWHVTVELQSITFNKLSDCDKAAWDLSSCSPSAQLYGRIGLGPAGDPSNTKHLVTRYADALHCCGEPPAWRTKLVRDQSRNADNGYYTGSTLPPPSDRFAFREWKQIPFCQTGTDSDLYKESCPSGIWTKFLSAKVANGTNFNFAAHLKDYDPITVNGDPHGADDILIDSFTSIKLNSSTMAGKINWGTLTAPFNGHGLVSITFTYKILDDPTS
ncbi:hypothetical protein ACIHFC_37225 [Streptomyces sp. NPDC052013]|uniref:hypothetical protein n=1 Tax=Streptomyces sp. NPDC052013 TaxID=3365679 RepID=UPI0037CDD12C